MIKDDMEEKEIAKVIEMLLDKLDEDKNYEAFENMESFEETVDKVGEMLIAKLEEDKNYEAFENIESFEEAVEKVIEKLNAKLEEDSNIVFGEPEECDGEDVTEEEIEDSEDGSLTNFEKEIELTNEYTIEEKKCPYCRKY